MFSLYFDQESTICFQQRVFLSQSLKSLLLWLQVHVTYILIITFLQARGGGCYVTCLTV